MHTCIVLLRGINVGGKNILSMAELVRILSDLRCRNVQTCVQSGNVLLDYYGNKLPDLAGLPHHACSNVTCLVLLGHSNFYIGVK